MKTQYLFQFGSSPALSLAEITAVFQHSAITRIENNGIIETESPLADPQKTLDALGGTLRIMEIIPESFTSPEEALGTLPNILTKLHTAKKERIVFSAGFLNPASNNLREGLENANRDAKRELKEAGFSVRYVALKKGERQLSPASVFHNKLTQGYEILFFEQDFKWYAARTRAVQNIESYSFRDEFRPFRDKRLGMLPLKVAQILLNLGQVKRGTRVLDPFVGLGTILSEALLLQAQVSGSDASQDVIERCKKNLDWYKAKLTPRASIALQVADVRNLSQLWKKPVDVIVTEGDLGDPIRGPKAHPNTIKKTFEESSLLLTTLFNEARRGVLTPGGTIVICAPYFPAKNGDSFGPYLDRLRSLGYTQRTLLPESEVISGFETSRGTLLYARPDAHVGREISAWKLN